jgi:GNAT superfamily N-acetyltransferase
VFHLTFSTWECRPGIWIEDLYVRPSHRRAGVGAALISRLANITLARGYTRLQWAALDSNTAALDFYVKIGAARLDEWKPHRLEGDALARVASQAGSAR